MTLASLLAPTPETQPSRKRGGYPPVAEDPEKRMDHINVAIERLIFGRPWKEIAEQFGISDRTAQKWTAAAPRYPEAPTRLRLAASRRRAS